MRERKRERKAERERESEVCECSERERSSVGVLYVTNNRSYFPWDCASGDGESGCQWWEIDCRVKWDGESGVANWVSGGGAMVGLFC